MPDHFDFEQVFDMFHKIHHVFNIKYHPLLSNLFTFIDRFIYEMEEVHVNKTSQALGNKIFSP